MHPQLLHPGPAPLPRGPIGVGSPWRTAPFLGLMLAIAPLAPCALLTPSVAWANVLDRDRDPVILLGSDLPGMFGTDPSRIVAFRYEAGWVQIPVQVDERAVVDFGTIYNVGPSGLTLLTYTDPTTFTGPDPNPLFDHDDELLLRAKDAGPLSAAGSEPPGTLAGSGIELEITNPLTAAVAYAYLFESDGSLDPGAGSHPVSYDFVLLSGDYLTTYDTLEGPNPEDSSVETAAYEVHFSDRWIRDVTAVSAGGASGADILDRHKPLFAPGVCTRTEETFSNGEGAFIVNREGPIRALRGYVGANSGPTTYRIHLFYEEREDVLTVLRVHPISGIMDYFDYAPAASGMTYRNDLNLAGVLVDGVPDAVVPGQVLWEMISGLQGTLVMTSLVNTDIPSFDYTSYYSDDTTPPATQCTGDAFEYGASGFWEDESIPNTDPSLGPARRLSVTRVIAIGSPNQDVPFAQARAAEAQTPLTAVAAPYVPESSAVWDDGGRSVDPGLRLAVEPNPTRAQFRARFIVPREGTCSLRLADLQGRIVATLFEGFLTAGVHERIGDLSRLPAGIYFLRARTPDPWPARASETNAPRSSGRGDQVGDRQLEARLVRLR